MLTERSTYEQRLLDTNIMYGRICASVISAGRKPRRRVADLMIAAIAVAEDLPLFTTNPDDFKGLDDLLTVVPVTRPKAPHEG
ncbi:hypothetical protein SYYSPA8_23920 [Streptomyces yaizuensis]|uniref:PIN domain-containing protein n=1 Tax=Streptomyces yaizuensis TaxID=2989713 RepID=A0ABQ5P4J4_9ACTN|nr:hypothetical protein SYYSPA8_23920 [Streptomyces sp. YSPA8]